MSTNLVRIFAVFAASGLVPALRGEIKVHIIEQYFGLSSTDAGGIGEPAKIATAAAVANAFYNATGARIRELPIRPAAVLAALEPERKGMTA